MNESDIQLFLNRRDYDIRKSHFGRWIDQKCTPDVVWSVSDMVLNFVDSNGLHTAFTVKDIWLADYTKTVISMEFSKPNVDSPKVSNEFDKFFSQPLNLLCYSGVLKDISPTSRHLYVVKDYDMLCYLANNDLHTFIFLCLYIEKVLRDSGLWISFETFFTRQTSNSYDELKTSFEYFCYNNTAIKNQKETGRIFTKVVNPLACKFKKLGTDGGFISKNMIAKHELMYNRDNFRDIYSEKPKNISRKEWVEINKKKFKINYGYMEHQMYAAKRWLRRVNDKYRNGVSELTQFSEAHNDMMSATQVHHIFSKNDFPKIQHYLENLIVLTPNQHFGFAHPKNNTQAIDIPAQKALLLAKTQSIKMNLESQEEERIYTFRNLLYVLSEGWNNDDVNQIADNDFNDVVHTINIHYSQV